MRMDQLAFYANTEQQKNGIKSWFGLVEKSWVTDTVTCVSDVAYGNHLQTPGYVGIENIAELNFNYDLGIEFEILRFVKGPSWHWLYGRPQPGWQPFISHIGIHLADGDMWPWQPGPEFENTKPPVGSIINGFGRLVQRTRTIAHTAEHFNDPASPAYGRRYEYEIYEIGAGAFVKYIRRINSSTERTPA